MATVTSATVTDGTCVVAVSDATGFYPGGFAYLFNVSQQLDGARQLLAVNGDDDELVFTIEVADLDVTPTAGLAASLVQWIGTSDVEAFIGLVPTGEADEDYLDMVTLAANAWAYRRRFAAGYRDNPDESPSYSVKLGTTIYAGALYRERGSADQYASFADMGTAPIGSNAQVLRLLGINRPAVA